MAIIIINISDIATARIILRNKFINLKVNYKLIKFVIDWQLNHLKPRTAKTKQRNQIKGSTKKIIAQKGSGGARHASKKAPIFVGGGVAHGPKGNNYKVKKINKKVRKLGLKSVLSNKFKSGKLIILEASNSDGKTSSLKKSLNKMGVINALIISGNDVDQNLIRAAANIRNLDVLSHQGLNVYDIVKKDNLIFSIDDLTSNFVALTGTENTILLNSDCCVDFSVTNGFNII